jgi:hypothetical protein
MPLHPLRGFYLQDLGITMSHALTSLELEADFELGRRLGVKILHPYRDADLVSMLCRTPPRLLNRRGRPTKLVQDSVARRFPLLDRDLGRQSVDRQSPSFFRTALATEADTEWRRLGGVRALADLRIVDPIATAKVFEDGQSGRYRTQEPVIDPRWDILSAEAWVRAHC